MGKMYTCAVDTKRDSLEAAPFTLSNNGVWSERGVHVIVKQGGSKQATMVLSQADVIDLATRLMAWAIHGTPIVEGDDEE